MIKYQSTKISENSVTGIETKRRNNRYGNEFKEAIVKEFFERGASIRHIARKYNIPTHRTVRDWIIKYAKGKGLKTYSSNPKVYTMKSRKVTHAEKIKIFRVFFSQ